MTDTDTQTLSELPNGISVVSVLRSDHGTLTHTYVLLHDGTPIGTATSLTKIADLLDHVN